ncbi:hypothetical protein SK128_027688 [Halocaridina rubra]|uniref:Uncharacterized protein n=1 Tax=Halocaridina rubra TaxID=373956 RepID=A0AAN8WR08_HALRR
MLPPVIRNSVTVQFQSQVPARILSGNPVLQSPAIPKMQSLYINRLYGTPPQTKKSFSRTIFHRSWCYRTSINGSTDLHSTIVSSQHRQRPIFCQEVKIYCQVNQK